MLEWEHAHGIDFLPPTMHLLRSSDPTKFNKCFRAQLVPARGPSAINVLGNSHSFLFTNCTAGSNPEMFPPQLREPVKHMPDAFPTGFWMHGLWFPKPRWWKKSLPGFGTSTHWFYENEQDEEQGEGEMDWLVGARVRSTHSWTSSSPSFTLQQQHNLPCAFDTALFQADSPMDSSSALFSSPLPVSTGACIIEAG